MQHETIECVVAQHPWLENDCILADIVLPVVTKFEMCDMEGWKKQYPESFARKIDKAVGVCLEGWLKE